MHKAYFQLKGLQEWPRDRRCGYSLLPCFPHMVGCLGTASNLGTSTISWPDSGMGATLELLMNPILFNSQHLAFSNLYLQIQCGSLILLVITGSLYTDIHTTVLKRRHGHQSCSLISLSIFKIFRSECF